MRLKPFKYINGEIYYQCNVCKQWFSKNGFYADNRREIGITSSCKSCHKKTSFALVTMRKPKREMQ